MKKQLSKIIEFADGEKAKANLIELFRTSDIFAKEYGLGGFKSLSDFIIMVNEEDPLVIDGFIKAIIERKSIEHGKTKEYSNESDESGFVERKIVYKTKSNFGFERSQLVEFLYNFGAPKDQIKDALDKIKSGKIDLPEYDHSWITGEELCKPDFPIDQVWQEMQENLKKGININVSMESLLGRK